MSQEGPTDDSSEGDSGDQQDQSPGSAGGPRIDHTSPKNRRAGSREASESETTDRTSSSGQSTFETREAVDDDAQAAEQAVEDLEDSVTSPDRSSESGDTDGDGKASSSTASTAGSGSGSSAGSPSTQGPGGGEADSPRSPEGTSDTTEYLEADGQTAGEFARSVLSEGALADGFQDGTETEAFPPTIDEGRYGGWTDFETDDVDSWSPLGETALTGGARRQAMARGDLSGTDHETEAVFRVDYDHKRGPPKLKIREMALYGFVSALGIEGPRKVYDADENTMLTESVTTSSRETVAVDKINPTNPDHHEWANRVDRDEAIDKLATHLLAGNWDLSTDNVRLGADGSIQLFDYDRVEEPLRDRSAAAERANYAATSMQRIDELRGDFLNITKEDIADRAVEIATEIEQQGQKDRLVRAAESYADIAREATDADLSMRRPPVELIQENIERMSEHED